MVNFRDIYDSIVSFSSRFIKNIAQLKVFIPQRQEHGDISTNLAIIMAKELKEAKEDEIRVVDQINKEYCQNENNQKAEEVSPKYCFNSISEELKKLKYVEKVDFIAGFCNIVLSKEFLKEGLIELLLKKERFGAKSSICIPLLR
jgi:arginyl-tRNA synthetase